MRAAILLAAMLISFNVAGAAIYDFSQEPKTPPASPPQAQQPPAQPAPARTTVRQPAPQDNRNHPPQNAVVQHPACAAGASCNDL